MVTERRGQIISLDAYRAKQGETKHDAISSVYQDASLLLGAACKRMEVLSEDAWASRNEAREDVAFLSWITEKIAPARPGGSVDLRRTITDYGYDPEEEASQRSCGLPYVPEAEQEMAKYQRRIGALSPLLRRLEGAGVKVKTGIKRVFQGNMIWNNVVKAVMWDILL